MHRVHNKTGGSRRYSLPFFMSPDPNAVIEPLAPFVGEEGVKFPPMDVGQHYVRRVLNSRVHHPSAKFVKKVSFCWRESVVGAGTHMEGGSQEADRSLSADSTGSL